MFHTDPVKCESVSYRILGQCAVGEVHPANEEECVEAILGARRDRLAVVPWGGGTAIGQGNPLAAERWMALCTDWLSGISEFSPDDMVVTAGAGTILTALQAELAQHNQFLPMDPPYADSATLGGIVATNAHGLWRPAFGIPRDRLLAVRVILADGSIVKGGAKVVKNVAGYDLCKIFAGSWGTLGLITEVTFKTNPRPERSAAVQFAAPSLEIAVKAALEAHTLHLDPVYLVADSGAPPRLAVGLMGSAEALAWQQEAVASCLVESGLSVCDEPPDEESLRTIATPGESVLCARLTMKPTETPAAAAALELIPGVRRILVQVPVGVVESALDPAAGPRAIAGVRQACPPAGHLVWTRVPYSLPEAVGDVWGSAGEGLALTRGIKRALDPDGLFSPGRFVGGI